MFICSCGRLHASFPLKHVSLFQDVWGKKWTFLHQPVALGTVCSAYRGNVRIRYHVVYGHGILRHRRACRRKPLTQFVLRGTPALSAMNGLWLAEENCRSRSSLPRLVNPLFSLHKRQPWSDSYQICRTPNWLIDLIFNGVFLIYFFKLNRADTTASLRGGGGGGLTRRHREQAP